MRLTPNEEGRLWIFMAAELARRRRERGLKLNYTESVALITDEMHEAARSGASYDEVVQAGMSVLTETDVMAGVAYLIDQLRVECVFVDGTRLIVLRDPIRPNRERTES